MAASYPEAVKNFSTITDGVDDVVAAHPNDRAAEITALETFLGATGSSQAYSESLLNLLKNYREGCSVEYKTAADLYVRAGEIMIYDASGNCRLRRNTSDLTVDWDDIDAGAEANSTTYYVYAVADAAGTTFTVLISTNGTTPTGATYYRLIGTFYNDGSGDIQEVGNLPKKHHGLGNYVAKANNTVYLAETDGFVMGQTTGIGTAEGLTDSSNPPTTSVSYGTSGNGNGNVMFPVRKGDYWKVTGCDKSVWWIPLG